MLSIRGGRKSTYGNLYINPTAEWKYNYDMFKHIDKLNVINPFKPDFTLSSSSTTSRELLAQISTCSWWRWLGTAHMQRAPMTIFRNLRWGYISDATSSFRTLKRSINWLWERFCVSQADVLLSGRADSTLSHHHITCSIYVNQVSEMVLTNRSLNFDVRTLQPHRADTCIFQPMSHAT